MIKKINHIGIAVKSIDESMVFYKDILNLTYLGQETVETEGVKVAFFSIGESKIELLEALNDDSTIAKFIKKRGEGIHHIAFDCKKIDDFTAKQKDYCIEPVLRSGAHNCWVSFIHPKHSNGVLIELTQKKDSC
ncbi:MAG TPA: methylmalonyl-CoA epimerase [Oligoflexia bacterium]|nr:methylmalonyl-CoA epimerase [Oligoflexia bacterium]HMR23917.1 methylmalonyl-CoA epimerase [Oligoflexia bacterium]